ncbi:MAG: TolC family protein [Phycisphaerales bacterium]|nr:TolC family protein [Phycisphaerales bacterium]
MDPASGRSWRRQAVAARRFIKRWLAGGSLMLLGACAAIDPAGDYDRASGLVRERAGADIYDPRRDAEIDAKVEALLADGLTVEEAVRLALLNNRGFQSLVAEIGASRADLAQSALLSNPSLALGLQFPEGGGLSNVTVAFGQQLADLWQLPVRRRIAEAELERTILAVGQRAVELSAEVRVRCYEVLAGEQALAHARENAKLVQRTVELSEAQLRAGEVSAFDVNLARTGALQVEEELIAARTQLEQARTNLAEALGLSLRSEEVRLVDALPDGSTPLATEADLLARAMDERFDLRVAYFDVQRAEAALVLECRRFMPDVQLGLAFERGERRPLPGRKILADTARSSIAAGTLTAPTIQSRGERALEKSQIIDAKLGPTLALTLPIFDQNQAQVAKAGVAVLQARKGYEAKVDAVAADVQRGASAARGAAEMLEFQRSRGLPQSQAAVEGAQSRYQAGEASVLVLIEAQDELVKRRRSFASALRDYGVALAKLEGAVGGRVLPTASVETESSAESPVNPSER